MNDFNAAADMIEELEELSLKYADYLPGDNTQIEYHDPETKEQAEKAKKLYRKTSNIALAVAAAFVVMLILTIISQTQPWKLVLMAALTAVPVYFAVKEKTRRIQVMTGKAVYKQKRITDIGTKKALYYVSVIPDSGEKVVYRLIQISKEDYEKVTEGTPVMVVDQYACIL